VTIDAENPEAQTREHSTESRATTEYRAALRSLLRQFRRVLEVVNSRGREKDELLVMADETIRENENKLRAILNTASDAIITIDQHGRVIAMNPATVRMFGYAEDELIGESIRLLVPEPPDNEHERPIQDCLDTGHTQTDATRGEVMARRSDGTTFPVEFAISTFQDGDGPMYTAIVHDITRRRELERHLADARIEEQQRVAQELHDGLGGQMTGVGMLVKALRTHMDATGSPHIAEVDNLARHIKDAHEQLRAISRGLSPVQTLPDGLAAALANLADTTDQGADTRCTFQTDGTVVHQPRVAAHLYRIAQEALSNALRHAQPKRIEIRLTQRKDHVVLSVRNDGDHFQDPADVDTGMGIRTMKHRAAVINGRLRITPAEGGGTLVACTVHNPLTPP